MKQVKKSFNMPESLSRRVDKLVEANPGISFTFVVVHALESWLKNPQVALVNTSGSKDESALERPPFGRSSRNGVISEV